MSFHPQRLRGMLSFSMKQFVVSIFTVVNTNIFAMLLGRFYGMRITGYYTQGNKWTNMGYGTISGILNTIGQPVLRQASDDMERLHRVFRKLLRFTAFVSFPCLFGLAIVAKELIVISVTAKWLASVRVMQILCIGAAFMPIGFLSGNLFNSIRQPSVYMWNTIMLGAIQLAALIITYRFGLESMLMVYSVINVVWILVWMCQIRRHIGIRITAMIKDISPYMVISALVMSLTMYLFRNVENLWLSLGLKILTAAGIYCLLMWRLKSAVFFEAVGYMKGHFRKH